MSKRLIRMPEVISKTGLQKSIIYKMISQGPVSEASPDFAKDSTGFLELEVDQWIDQRVSERAWPAPRLLKKGGSPNETARRSTRRAGSSRDDRGSEAIRSSSISLSPVNDNRYCSLACGICRSPRARMAAMKKINLPSVAFLTKVRFVRTRSRRCNYDRLRISPLFHAALAVLQLGHRAM